MQDLDSAMPEPESDHVRLGEVEYSDELMDQLCEHSVACTGFSMAPVMSVMKGDDLDAAPLSVERQVLIMLNCEDGAISMTLPLLAFDSFVSMACNVYERVSGSAIDRVVNVEAMVDDAVAEFRRDLGLTDG